MRGCASVSVLIKDYFLCYLNTNLCLGAVPVKVEINAENKGDLNENFTF